MVDAYPLPAFLVVLLKNKKEPKPEKNKLENKQKTPQNICLVAPTGLKGFELGFKICKSRHFLEHCSVSTLGFSLCPTERATWPSPHFLVFFLSQSTCNPRKQITVAWLWRVEIFNSTREPHPCLRSGEESPSCATTAPVSLARSFARSSPHPTEQ